MPEVSILRYNDARYFDLSPLRLTAMEWKIMRVCLTMSEEIFLGRIDGDLVCIWGLAPPMLLSNQAYLWLWVSPKLEEHKFTFVRRSQMVVQEALKDWPIITGHCQIGDEKACKWLRWLGATFGAPDGRRIPFQITRRA